MLNTLLLKVKAWIKDQWDKNGSKYLFSISGLAGAWQAVILSGFVEAGNIERRLIAAVLVWAATHGVARSMGTAPKSEAAK